MRLKGKAKDDFLALVNSPDFSGLLTVAVQTRALLNVVRDASTVPSKAMVERYLKAMESVACFCGVYKEYLVRLVTAGLLPRENDSGDIELFLYSVDDDHIVATSDGRWKSIADAAGFPHRVRTVPVSGSTSPGGAGT